MTDDAKARLVDELAEAIHEVFKKWPSAPPEWEDMATACLPIITRLLAAHDLDAVQLRAQVKYLRDYAISKAADVVTATNGGNHPTPAQYSALIGGIDGNIAVAGERAVAQAKAATGGGDEFVPCPDCGGSGIASGPDPACPMCGTHGSVPAFAVKPD